MGGLKIDETTRVINTNGKAIPNLYAAGEVCGGVHGKNRLGGNSLLDCVVLGRVAGRSATEDLLKTCRLTLEGKKTMSTTSGADRLANLGG